MGYTKRAIEQEIISNCVYDLFHTMTRLNIFDTNDFRYWKLNYYRVIYVAQYT